jgi:hypothetical protein
MVVFPGLDAPLRTTTLELCGIGEVSEATMCQNQGLEDAEPVSPPATGA